MERKRTIKKSTKAEEEFAVFDLVENSRKDDSWNDFISDLKNKFYYLGGNGLVYQRSQGNDFTKKLDHLLTISAQHAAIVSGKQLYVCGNGLYLGDDPSQQLMDWFGNNPELAAAKAKNDALKLLGGDYHIDLTTKQFGATNIDMLTRQIAKDMIIYGGSYVLAHVNQKRIIKLVAVPQHHVYVAVPQEGEDKAVRRFYLSADGKIDKDKTTKIQEFNAQSNDPVQMIEFRMPHCIDSIYPYPDYLAAIKWILLDGSIADFFSSMSANRFNLGGILKIGQAPPNEQTRKKAKDELTKDFGGMHNAGKLMVLWGANSDTSYEAFQIASSDDLFEHQQQYIKQNIRVSHKVTDPALLGLPSDVNSGVVFQNPDSLAMSLTVFQNTVISPIQQGITDVYNQVLNYNGIDEAVSIDEFKPLPQSNIDKNETNVDLNDAEMEDDNTNEE